MLQANPVDPAEYSPQQIAAMIDHTLLKPYAMQIDIDELCEEAAQNEFASVSINPVWASYCAKRLANTNVGINATVGFPLGANTAHVKMEEAIEAVRNGATELDMVINIGALKSGFPSYVEREIESIVKAVPKIPVKVILETSYLSEPEKVAVCEMCLRAKAAYVKTSTGFGDHGATVEDVALMRSVVGSALGVKAAGGVRSYKDVLNMIRAGANRVGTSASLSILAEMRQNG